MNRTVRSLVSGRAKNFSFLQKLQIDSNANPSSLPKGTRGSFSAGKAARLEADQSYPSTAEFKNEWSYIPTPLFVFVGVHSGKSAFLYLGIICGS
jgi:hypothetical protein